MNYQEFKEELQKKDWPFIRVRKGDGKTVRGFNRRMDGVNWSKIDNVISRHAPAKFLFDCKELVSVKEYETFEIEVQELEPEKIETPMADTNNSFQFIDELRELERLRVQHETAKARIQALEKVQAEYLKKIEELEIQLSMEELGEPEEEEPSTMDTLAEALIPVVLEGAPKIMQGLGDMLSNFGRKNQPPQPQQPPQPEQHPHANFYQEQHSNHEQH